MKVVSFLTISLFTTAVSAFQPPARAVSAPYCDTEAKEGLYLWGPDKYSSRASINERPRSMNSIFPSYREESQPKDFHWRGDNDRRYRGGGSTSYARELDDKLAYVNRQERELDRRLDSLSSYSRMDRYDGMSGRSYNRDSYSPSYGSTSGLRYDDRDNYRSAFESPTGPYSSSYGLSSTTSRQGPYSSGYGTSRQGPYSSGYGMSHQGPYSSGYGTSRQGPYSSGLYGSRQGPYSSGYASGDARWADNRWHDNGRYVSGTYHDPYRSPLDHSGPEGSRRYDRSSSRYSGPYDRSVYRGTLDRVY